MPTRSPTGKEVRTFDMGRVCSPLYVHANSPLGFTAQPYVTHRSLIPPGVYCRLMNSTPLRSRAQLAAIVATLIAAAVLLSSCQATRSSPAVAPSTTTASGGDDPAAIALEALTGPEGEYAAVAAYTAVLDRYGADVEPYASILTQEQRHVSALTRHLQRLGVEVPENDHLDTIPAPKDLTTAAQAWADGEVANVAMYDDLLSRLGDQDPMLTRVLSNLRRASEQVHLPLFSEAAAGDGTLPPGAMSASHPGSMGHGGG